MTKEEAHIWYGTGYDGYSHTYVRSSSSSAGSGGVIFLIVWVVFIVALSATILTPTLQPKNDPQTAVKQEIVDLKIKLIELENQLK